MTSDLTCFRIGETCRIILSTTGRSLVDGLLRCQPGVVHRCHNRGHAPDLARIETRSAHHRFNADHLEIAIEAKHSTRLDVAQWHLFVAEQPAVPGSVADWKASCAAISVGSISVMAQHWYSEPLPVQCVGFHRAI